MRGADIAKAIALGARGVMIGKATLFGVGAAGEAGAARAFELLSEELTRVMTFSGVANLDGLRPDLLNHR